MRTLTLRIKKCWLDEIASGKKRVEYRQDKAFYQKMFHGKSYTFLVLHYQQKPRLFCLIESIKRIPVPAEEREYFTESHVWAISITEARRYEA